MPPRPLATVVAALDSQLRTGEIRDYPNALNGLQLENRGGVTRVAAAVDASPVVIEAAISRGADLLLVHHGMFWGGLQPLTGAHFRKVRRAIEGGLAIYSSHLPLDVHHTLGNNRSLAAAIGLQGADCFLPVHGTMIGLRGTIETTRADLAARVESAVAGRVHVCPGGPDHVVHVGIVTGGGGSEVAAAAAAGIDTFITGEGPHWSYTLAEELGINVLYAGHYATETLGVQQLARWLEARFDLPWSFIDHPTGL